MRLTSTTVWALTSSRFSSLARLPGMGELGRAIITFSSFRGVLSDDLELDRDRDLDRDRERDLDRERERDLDRERERDLELEDDLDLDRDLERDLDDEDERERLLSENK